MMIAIAITCLFVVTGVATLLSLLDTWMQARTAFWDVYREKQLLEAGFVPQVEAQETRLRQPLPQRLPQRLHQPLHRTARRVRKSGFGGSQRSSLGSLQALG